MSALVGGLHPIRVELSWTIRPSEAHGSFVAPAVRRGGGTPGGSVAAAFPHTVFWLHDKVEIRKLFEEGGFGKVEVGAATPRLDVPEPRNFLWQYINLTPMAGAGMKVDEATETAFERESLTNRNRSGPTAA